MEEDWYVLRNLLKENSRLFEDKVYSSTSNLLNLPFCLEPYKNLFALLKHGDLLACAVVFISCETIRFWHREARYRHYLSSPYNRCVSFTVPISESFYTQL